MGPPTADTGDVTTQGTTDDRASAAEETAAGAALAAGLEAVARLHDDAMAVIARLAEGREPTGDDRAQDDVRVLRLAERPTVAQRAENAAA
jgi:hypothetical protein